MATLPTVTELFARGYCVLPAPRSVKLTGQTLAIPGAFSVELAEGVEADSIAPVSLRTQTAERTGASEGAGGPTIRLTIEDSGAGAGQPDAILSQGYAIDISAEGVEVAGNAAAGLFYGVQTLVQLLKQSPGGQWTLPVGRIEDWPDHELRLIHYDTKHHQERMEAVKGMIDRLAHFKVNGFLWEIEDKFAYQSHPLIGAPGAFTADELREITAYALARYVEVIPILQMPSHNAFIAKHEPYKRLLEHADNNYMLDPTDPEVHALYKDLIAELVEATPGCRYFHLGTDEPYFLGDGRSKARCGGRSKGEIFAEFICAMVPVAEEMGRTVMYWGEHPMTAEHVKLLPPGTINSVMLDAPRSREYRVRGIRELLYVPTQGARLMFPDYWRSSRGQGAGESRLDSMVRKIRTDGHREQNVIGTLIAAWDDSGLNMETFWLGWVTGSSVGWNPDGADVEELIAAFMGEFYGPATAGLTEAWRGLDELADFWLASWQRVPSRRGPSFMRRYHPRRDLSLPLPNLPDPQTLDNRPFWRGQHAELLRQADEMELRATRLIATLLEQMPRARRNVYNLEVLVSVARLLAHQITLLRTLAEVEDRLSDARSAWDGVRSSDAIGHLRSAVDLVRRCVQQREDRYDALVTTWEKARLPKGMSAGGRDFVHIQDDTKNHTADHTADLGYLVEAARNLELEAWAQNLERVIESFSREYGAIRPQGDYMVDE